MIDSRQGVNVFPPNLPDVPLPCLAEVQTLVFFALDRGQRWRYAARSGQRRQQSRCIRDRVRFLAARGFTAALAAFQHSKWRKTTGIQYHKDEAENRAGRSWP